ncbi:hypothetical protein LCM20_12785 [Halobacillus litoralis]|uniref:hypothetical protein n=1 Tax=Halobacillus litoralis TaxID=45668 RepID=UPI001CD59CE6|nr:hypothetical protein [Halobacillus litoralis]MCA0971474.1 hypothetical protein [Halobacillus litoralis]
MFNMYDRCCRYIGKDVRLTHEGRVHYGRVTRVDRNYVWIRPSRGPGGYGYFYGGFGIPFALGAVTGIALASAFFW